MALVWEPEVAELRRRIELSNQGGSPDRIGHQHRLGRLTIRERIHALLDDGSFREVGALAGLGEHEDGELVDFSPSSYVMGIGKIDGRPVAIGGEDWRLGAVPDAALQGRCGRLLRGIGAGVPHSLGLAIDGAGANVGATRQMGTT